MNNEQIIGQKDLEHEIMELEDRLAYKKDQLEKLKFINANGRYFLNADGGIHEMVPTVNSATLEKTIKQGNAFKTRKDAEKERDRRALLHEFNQFKNECNNGWTPNWEDGSEIKYFIGLNHVRFNLDACGYYCLLNFSLFGYFNKKEHCLEAIEKFGDRIKKLYIE